MSWLMRVIARLRIIRTQPLEAPVLPTQTVGLAPQELTAKAGNKRSAVTTKPRKSKLLAQPVLQKKPKVVQSTKAVSKDLSKKPKPVQTAKSPKTDGKCTPTVVSKTRRHAK